jgi:hypothetical protein
MSPVSFNSSCRETFALIRPYILTFADRAPYRANGGDCSAYLSPFLGLHMKWLSSHISVRSFILPPENGGSIFLRSINELLAEYMELCYGNVRSNDKHKISGLQNTDYEECHLLGYKTPVRTSQETHYVSVTESSQLMLCKI